MTERIIQSDGIEIATEAFGDPSHPPVLLIMGGMASMLWWPGEFCERLAARGRYAIRYDHRDTGHSTKYPPGQAPYTFDDFADDGLRVLDGYGIRAAHIVAMSIGGMLGQLLALRDPSRVLSLTTISSTPIGIDTSNLPSSTDEFMRHVSEDVDWSDGARVVDYMVEDARVLGGKDRPFDGARYRAFIERDFARSNGYASATNHGAIMGGTEPPRRLQEMEAPLLVIHGSVDPVFPIAHGEALAKAVQGTRLVRIEGGGHELNEVDWDTMIDAIAAHTMTPPQPIVESA